MIQKQRLLLISIFFLFVVSCKTTVSKEINSETSLGEHLFFDPILSRDSSVSCASCHKPEFAFADNEALSKGIYKQRTTRNTPSCMNVASLNAYFWDGRAETLEEQALGPIESAVEMDLPISLAVKRLLRNSFYKETFYRIYGKAPSSDLMAKALAEYQRTLETSNTPFDKWMNGKDTTLMSESAKRGLNIFNNKGKCFDCHFGGDFTGNDKFKNIGLYNGKDLKDEGRSKISMQPKDLGTFKTPGLRNIAVTAPYMHDGRFKTLAEVIDYYNEPDKFVANSINRDTLLNKPLGLSKEEKKDLENFLLSLTDTQFIKK